MISKEQATVLHDRATRGGQLSAEERQALDLWYDAQDKEEDAVLSAAFPRPDAAATLNRAIEVVGVKVQLAEDRIQSLTRENAALRQEIAALQQRLPKPAAARPA
jgi:hypothetical protein